MDFLSAFLYAFATLFVVMDPFSSMGVFVAMTKKFSDAERTKCATQAVAVAGVLVLVFLFFGAGLLDVMGISVRSFQIAGGVILALLGLQLVLGFSLGKEGVREKSSVALVIATPLLTGPGVLTATIVLVEQHDVIVTGFAAAASLAISWFLVRYTVQFKNALGKNGDEFVRVFSKIMGLLVVALAVEFIRTGLGIA